MQRQGAARRVSRGLSFEIDPPEYGGPIPRSSRHDHRACTATAIPSWSRRIGGPDWQDPGTRGMRRIESATVISSHNNPSFNFYPNLVAPVDPSGVPFLRSGRLSDTTMRIECHWFAPDWGGGPPPELWKTRIANFDRILDEDLQFAPQIQESLMSPGFRGIPLSYQERRIYHWHEELDRRIGRGADPAGACASSRCSSHSIENLSRPRPMRPPRRHSCLRCAHSAAAAVARTDRGANRLAQSPRHGAGRRAAPSATGTRMR